MFHKNMITSYNSTMQNVLYYLVFFLYEGKSGK